MSVRVCVHPGVSRCKHVDPQQTSRADNYKKKNTKSVKDFKPMFRCSFPVPGEQAKPRSLPSHDRATETE